MNRISRISANLEDAGEFKLARELESVGPKKISAGTWSLPFKEKKAKKLHDLVADIMEVESKGADLKIPAILKTLYDTYGNDALLDDVEKIIPDPSENKKKGKSKYGILLDKEKASRVLAVIKKAVAQLLRDYHSEPKTFKESLNEKAAEYLDKIIKMK